MAVSHGYSIQLLEPSTEWKFKPKQLALKNSHGVAKQKIEQMLERYERNLTVISLLEKWNLKSIDVKKEEILVAEEEAEEDENSEIYNSEDEDSLENVEETENCHSTLNPNVTEFIPDYVPADNNCEEMAADVGDDISNLVNIFPHLTVEGKCSDWFKLSPDGLIYLAFKRLDPKFCS